MYYTVSTKLTVNAVIFFSNKLFQPFGVISFLSNSGNVPLGGLMTKPPIERSPDLLSWFLSILSWILRVGSRTRGLKTRVTSGNALNWLIRSKKVKFVSDLVIVGHLCLTYLSPLIGKWMLKYMKILCYELSRLPTYNIFSFNFKLFKRSKP